MMEMGTEERKSKEIENQNSIFDFFHAYVKQLSYRGD